ncbi:MAG: helix-turn-helix domain-containing protein [Algibacter sp.]
MDVLIIIGAFQAIFFTILVLSKKGKSVSDKILAVWLSVFAVYFSFVYYSFQSGHVFYIDYGHYPVGAIVLFYSLMYVYTKSLISEENLFKVKWLLHLIPAAIVYISTIPLAMLSYEEKADLVTHSISNTYFNLVFGVIILFITIYIVATLRLLKKHKVSMRNMFSYEEKINLNWLRILAFLLILLWVVISGLTAYVFYMGSSSNLMSPEDHMILDVQGQSAFVIFVFLLGYFGIKQQVIYSVPIAKDDFTVKTENNKSHIVEPFKEQEATLKYGKSGLNEDMASQIYTNLKTLVKENAIYKNEALTLVELAKQLKVHPNHLSQVINEKEEKNFYNYINALRIKEFIKLASLPENKKYTMISLAYDCGFSTKSTFNKHFKLQTGKTPTEFFST